MELGKYGKQKKQYKTGQSFSTSADDRDVLMSSSTSKIRKQCILCHGEHFVDKCRNFRAKASKTERNFKEKRHFVLHV